MSPPKFTSVDDYLASLDPAKETTLRSMIDVILDEFPELESKVAWNVPTIKRDRQYVMGFSAARNHLSINPWSAQVIDDFRARLEGFVVLKAIFQIPVDWEIDRDLVKGLVRARLAELD